MAEASFFSSSSSPLCAAQPWGSWRHSPCTTRASSSSHVLRCSRRLAGRRLVGPLRMPYALSIAPPLTRRFESWGLARSTAPATPQSRMPLLFERMKGVLSERPRTKAARPPLIPRFPGRAFRILHQKMWPQSTPTESYSSSSCVRPGFNPFRSSSTSGSSTGEEMRYTPLAHFPRSICLQRSLQKGNSSPFAVISVRQVGQRKMLFFWEAFLLMLLKVHAQPHHNRAPL